MPKYGEEVGRKRVGGTVPRFPVTAGSEARVPIRAVESGGMGWKGGVVDGGRVVGSSGRGVDRHTNIYKGQTITWGGGAD